jgi:hypothetical protein
MNTNGIRLMAGMSRGGNVGDGRGTKCFGRRAVKGLGILWTPRQSTMPVSVEKKKKFKVLIELFQRVALHRNVH